MRTKGLHISIFLLIGLFSLQSIEFDSVSYYNLFSETEVEESIVELGELDFEQELSFSDSNDSGNTPILGDHSLLKNPLNGKSTFRPLGSKDLSAKTHLFILYCCLKLDC